VLMVIIAIGGGAYFVYQSKPETNSSASLSPQNEQASNTPSSSSYGYNPNYADAIQLKKPELCKNIEYALQSGPTDSIEKLSGEAAIEICEQQAKQGYFGCECDSESTLNAMRVR
jgi:hypothetical protein